MCTAILAGAFVCVFGAASPTTRTAATQAQATFRLELLKTDLKHPRTAKEMPPYYMLIRMSSQDVMPDPGAPRQRTDLPKGMPAKVTSYSVTFGQRRVGLAVATDKGHKPSMLCMDTNGNGKLADDKPITSSGIEWMDKQKRYGRERFGPIVLVGPKGGKTVPAKVVVERSP